MSWASAFAGFVRTLLIAAATAAAAFGLLVVFQPFGKPATPVQTSTIVSSPGTSALQGRIEALRLSLRETEAALDNVNSQSLIVGPAPDDALRTQYEAQIAAASERRDLALRHADAIRQGLEAAIPVSSLAEIRDSVVIGQLLSQQAALESQIAIEGVRLRASHPTMRALTAQRGALATQIRQEAASIAGALEAEARLDDAQIELLQSKLPAAGTAPAPADNSALSAKAAAQRAELDSLVDAYFNIPPATTTTTTAATTPAANPLSLANLLVVGVAGLAAILFQILLASRRRRRVVANPGDIEAWTDDNDPELAVATEPEPLRKAS